MTDKLLATITEEQPDQEGFKGCKEISPAGPNSSSNSLVFMGIFMPLSHLCLLSTPHSSFPHSCWTRAQPEATQLLASPSGGFEFEGKKRRKNEENWRKKCLRDWSREDSGRGDSKAHMDKTNPGYGSSLKESQWGCARGSGSDRDKARHPKL